MYRIRPVPVVFLLLAFMPQLSVNCNVCVSWDFICVGCLSDCGAHREGEGEVVH